MCYKKLKIPKKVLSRSGHQNKFKINLWTIKFH